MASNGIEGLLFETHNWGKTVAFWKDLGFELTFETDHHSGRLRHPAGGPWMFVAERPEDQELVVAPILSVDDADAFKPPAAGHVDQGFAAQHWGVLQMLLRDPDGRLLSVEAPMGDTASAPAHH